MLAKEIMNSKVITVQESATIEEIAEILVHNNISGAPVVNQDGDLVGIVTEEDLLHQETNPRTPGFLNILGAFIYINGIEQYREDFKKLAATKAQEIMTTEVITVNADTDIRQVAALMVEHDINRLPVVEDKKIIGIISRADIVKTLANKA
ncbi:MAG: Hypoxic response protein 1 [Pelotomaculum sp. PtaB.Bin104]|nr:MAG: Hypoxic response protein 1 [Pelotomaculum sp. PtaB.Bin104]